MLRKITDFARGFLFGLVVGGSAGMLIAPAPGEETQSVLESRIEAAKAAFDSRIEAAKAAFEQGRAKAEKELLEYFEQAKQPSAGKSGFQ